MPCYKRMAAFRGYMNLAIIINDVVRKWSGPERTERGKSQTITTVDYFIATLRTFVRANIFAQLRHVLHLRNRSTFFFLDYFLSFLVSRSFIRFLSF